MILLNNPSKRNEKAKFLIHIGNDFIVDSYCVRLDKLEPEMFGTNTPDSWLMEKCHELIYEKNPNDSCCYKSFIVEIELKSIARAKRYDKGSIIEKLRTVRAKSWKGKNVEKMNPSERNKQ